MRTRLQVPALRRIRIRRRDIVLTPDDLAAIEPAIPAGAAAGDRYPTQQMAALDSERRPRAHTTRGGAPSMGCSD